MEKPSILVFLDINLYKSLGFSYKMDLMSCLDPESPLRGADYAGFREELGKLKPEVYRSFLKAIRERGKTTPDIYPRVSGFLQRISNDEPVIYQECVIGLVFHLLEEPFEFSPGTITHNARPRANLEAYVDNEIRSRTPRTA